MSKTHHLEAASESERRCALVTYRDPRDVVCSSARRRIKCGNDCSAEMLEETVIEQLDFIYFGSDYDGQWAPKLALYRADADVSLLRYESFVDQLPELVDALADYFGVSSALGNEERVRIASDWSIERVAERAEALGGGDFSNFDERTHVHGGHISNGGRVGDFRSCLTPETERLFHDRLAPMGLLPPWPNDDGTPR